MLTNDIDLHNGAAIGQTFKGTLSIFNLISMEAMLISGNGLNSRHLQQTLLFVNFLLAFLNTTACYLIQSIKHFTW